MTDVKTTTPKQQVNQPHSGQDPIAKATEKAKEVAGHGRKGGGASMMGAAAGAVAGAALGGIAGAALTDEKTRKTVTEQLGKMAKTAGDTIKKLDENQDTLKKNLSDTAKTLKDTSEPMQKTGVKKS